jgi:2-polyprenyl-6-methoxyphenol hydroxylase-like FAD-dependent oxidoreductase
MPNAIDTPVLIVGAGPTGLTLALWLARLGVHFRIIDKTSDVAPYSRALGVHARTLELYQQLGFADQALAGGTVVPSINLWARRKRVVTVPFSDAGEGTTPFPFVLDFAQDAHERLLVSLLDQLGIAVERATELTAFSDNADGVRASLRHASGATEECVCSYLAGCDGAHSTVRNGIGAQFSGGTYEHLFYVADVAARGPTVDGGIHVDIDEADLLAIFDMKGTGRVRLVGTIKNDVATHGQRDIVFDDVARRPIEQLQLEVETVNWFSTYRVHHRVASHFRVGRAFLAGDAAHVHSPVGAQGMNTGIGDAVNLAWKLAAVVRDGADTSVLDTYEVERIAFARRLVATTDRAFAIATRPGAVAAFLRTTVFPLVVSLLFRFRPVRGFLFHIVSQLGISYPDSSLSVGRAGSVGGGDRLPWVRSESGSDGTSNFAPLASLRWQVHVYGDGAPGVRQACEELGLEHHAFAWRAAVARSGLARDATYLVRPDGYVALVDATGGTERLREYVASRPWVRGAKKARLTSYR